mgnify:CR=1 FL=1|jgi:hypothetical protein
MKKIKTETFDKKFDDNEEMETLLDWSKAKRLNEMPMRVSIDFPKWMVQSLDQEARHFGLSRQALIKLSVAEHIKSAQHV